MIHSIRQAIFVFGAFLLIQLALVSNDALAQADHCRNAADTNACIDDVLAKYTIYRHNRTTADIKPGRLHRCNSNHTNFVGSYIKFAVQKGVCKWARGIRECANLGDNVLECFCSDNGYAYTRQIVLVTANQYRIMQNELRTHVKSGWVQSMCRR